MTRIFLCKGISIVGMLVIVLLFLTGLPSIAQQPQSQQQQDLFSPQLLGELKQIQQAALDSDYAYRQVAYLCDNIGPRLSGSPQAQRAVEYVADELRKLGLEVKLEKIMVPHWVRGAETGELVEFPGQAPQTKQKIVLAALGGSVATPADGLTAEVVVANDFAELQALGREKVAGKIVLFNYKFDQRMAAEGFGGEAYRQAVAYRGAGASVAAKLGAVAALVRSAGGSQNRLVHTGAMRYAKDVPQIPAAAVSFEDAELISHLVKDGRVRLHLTLTPQQLPEAVSYNVIGDLKGSEHPEQIVIVSGHLDSWDLGTGAIDDAAGVAVAMQTAQTLKRLNLRPKRTIRVIAWMNEENGTAGGRTYAKDYASEIPNHFAAIESDRGAGHPLGFEAMVHKDVIGMLGPLSNLLRSQGAGLMKRTEETETDITPIAELGVPAFGLWQDTRFYFNYHHTEADTLDKVNPQELAENAAEMAALAYALANLPQALPREAPKPAGN